MKARTLGCILAISAAAAFAQEDDGRPTLPDLAREVAPGPIHLVESRELVLVAIESQLPEADLIIHGTVETSTCQLTADQKDLYTDYVVAPQRVIRDRLSHGGAPVTVRTWGGQTTIEGVQVTQEDDALRRFVSGEQLVLLLTYDEADGVYRSVGDSGALSVGVAGISLILRMAADDPLFSRWRGMSVEQFEAEVRRLSRPQPNEPAAESCRKRVLDTKRLAHSSLRPTRKSGLERVSEEAL